MANNVPSLRRTWLLLLLPPVLFLLVIIAASVYFGFQSGGDAEVIANSTTQATPVLLLLVQLILLLLFGRTLRAERLTLRDLGWRVRDGQRLGTEVLLGVVPGVILVLLYIVALEPLMTLAQTNIGDYVPAGSLLTSLGSSVLPFFLANVVLAPWVEENIYRGYALTRLSQRYRTPIAIAISCLFFGLLHWAGGFWYILLTGVLAGGLFAGLTVWRKNMVAPFAAHLALNLVEFLYVWLWVAG